LSHFFPLQDSIMSFFTFKSLRRFLLAAAWLAGSIGLALLLWQGLAWWLQHSRGIPFPAPLMVLERLGELLSGTPWLGSTIWGHLGASAQRWGIGFALGSVLGSVWGLGLGSSRLLTRLTGPWVEALQLVPGLAWIPVALLLFGVGPTATVAMITVVTVPAVALPVAMGVRRVDPHHRAVAKMLGASRWALMTTVVLPSVLPFLLTGLRLGMGTAWRVLVAGEMVVGVGGGLGYVILQSRWNLDFEGSLAGVLVIALVGFCLERGVFGTLERRTIARWGTHGG
jgi:ABC-type nitrate/sulfonate/bicarbonate transport system permease component